MEGKLWQRPGIDQLEHLRSKCTQDDVDAGDRDSGGVRAAAEEEVPRAGLGPTHWGESFRSGIGVGLLVSELVLVFVLDLAKKPLIGKSLVDQIFSVLMYISKVSLQ